MQMNMTETGGLVWTSMAPMPSVRTHHTMVAAERKIFVIGGTFASDMYVFHIDNRAWQTVDLQMVTLQK